VALAFTQSVASAAAATGNQTYTHGLGVVPAALILYGSNQTADGQVAGASGFFAFVLSPTSRRLDAWASDDAGTSSNAGTSVRDNAAVVLLTNGTPTRGGTADFVSMTSTQFTLNWSVAPPANTKIHVAAVGGADLTDSALFSFTSPTAAGNQALTTPGFKPDLCLFYTPFNPVNNTTDVVDASLAFGAASRAPFGQGAMAWFENDGSNTMDCAVIQRADRCIVASLATSSATGIQASLKSFDATGVTLTWNNVDSAARTVFCLALKGCGAQVGVDTEPTTNSAKTVAGCPFTPRGVLAYSTGQTADGGSIATNSTTLTSGGFFGASDGTNEGCIGAMQYDGHADSQSKRTMNSTKALELWKWTSAITTAGNRATSAACGAADVTLTADGFTHTWTSTDGTARRFLYVVLGDAPTGPVRVQGASHEQVGGGNVAQAFPLDVTVGNTIIAAVSTNLDSLAAATCADTLGNVYTRDRVAPSAGTNAVLFSAPVTAGGACTVTVTATGTNDRSPAIAEWSGLASPAPDVGVVGTGTTTPYATGNTPVLSQADEVVILVASHDDSGSVIPTAAGYIIPADNLQAGTVNMPILMGYKIVAATGAQSASVAWTTATTAYVAMLQTYKVAGGGGPATQTLALAGAGSAATAGVATALPGPVAVAVAGVPSAEASGQPATLPAYTAPLAGAGSAEVAGQPALSTAYTASLSGAGSGERAGQPVVLPGVVALLPAGAASGEAAGRAAVAVLAVLALAGAASSEVLGVPALLPGGVTAALAGVGSGEVGGQPAVGVFTFVALAGAASGERGGQLAALPGGLTLPLAGAGSGEAAGQLVAFTVGAPAILALSGAGTAERAGVPLALPGVALLTPAGLGSAERAGVATLLPGGLILPLAGVGSGEQRGAPTLSTTVALALAGVGGGERAGAGLVLPGSVTLALVGAASGERAGVLTIGGITIPFFVFVARPQHEGFGASGELFVFVGRPQGQGG
jgi:hypothetical protein